MLFVDDLSVIFVIQRRLTKLLTKLFLNLLQKLILHFSVAVNVVRGYAGLSTISDIFQIQYVWRKLDICRFIYNAGAFSPKLQGDRRKMFAGLSHNLFSHSLTAGEKDVVEVLLKKAGVLLAPAHNNGNIILPETFADDFADDIAGGRSR